MSCWTIIGLGNRFRGDDCVGPYIVHRLRNRLTSSVSCIENHGDMANLLEEWKHKRVCLIDAVQADDAQSGEIFRLDGLVEKFPESLCRASSHGLNLGEALELSQTLDALPEELHIYAICGKDFSFGAGLSTAVQAAAEQVEQEILANLNIQTGGL